MTGKKHVGCKHRQSNIKRELQNTIKATFCGLGWEVKSSLWNSLHDFSCIKQSLSYSFWESHSLWSPSCSTDTGKMKWKVIYIAWCCKIWFKLTFSLSIDTGKCYVSVCVSLVLQQMNWKSCILLLWEKASTQSCHLALSSSLAMLDRLFWGCLSLLCLNNIGTTSSLTNLQVPKSSLKTSFSHHKNI